MYISTKTTTHISASMKSFIEYFHFCGYCLANNSLNIKRANDAIPFCVTQKHKTPVPLTLPIVTLRQFYNHDTC